VQLSCIWQVPIKRERFVDGNFLLLRPYHGEHGPKVPVTPEYIVSFAAGAAKTGMYVNPNLNEHASDFFQKVG
jgi:hypothetical protein